MTLGLESKKIPVDSYGEAVEMFFKQGWTDGLPIVPPTEQRVEEFLDYAGLRPADVVGEIPERDRVITAEKLAVNAVMAGCLPEYMPVLVAAVQAVTDPAFKFNHLASLGSPWPAFIVNGPITRELDFNSSLYLLGPGNRVNATIGRAVSLLLSNCAEAKVGGVQRGLWGHPGRWSTVIPENEDTGWPPLHSLLGFNKGSSTVTAVSHYPDLYMVLALRETPELILDSVADAISTYDFVRGIYVLLIPPHFVDVFVRYGWSKTDVRDYLFENCKRSVAALKRRGRWGGLSAKVSTYDDGTSGKDFKAIEPGDENRFAYVFKPCEYDDMLFGEGTQERRADVFVVVCGGNAGPRLTFLVPYSASSDAVTKVIQKRE